MRALHGFFPLAMVLAAASAQARAKRAAHPAEPAAPPVPAADISTIKDSLKVLSDGKSHYVAVVPFGAGKELFYGDGKTFYAQRVFSSGSVGKESFDYAFWEPRVSAPYKASFELRDGKFRVRCDERLTEVTPVPEGERQSMLASARFLAARWRYRAHALARDDRGTYYYVDRGREPEDSKTYRIYAGLKGAMKPLKMLNIVSDSQGEIFSTPAGELRLVLDRKETVWIRRNQRTPLTNLAVEDNHVLIYTDLGVYTGQRLGTPCDDL
ncbi:MAG TPA: hypothetical protein VFH68_14060 [Polyangia bacterium]|nr:hypothetical protein [Polyangia bacterium]